MSESSVPVPRPSEPLPCPFCGSKAVMNTTGAGCTNTECDAHLANVYLRTWNRRSPSVPTATQGSEEAANSDTERLNWLERQIPTASSGGYRLKSWREAADAPRYYLVGDSAIIEDEHLSLRAAIDAARVQGENSQ